MVRTQIQLTERQAEGVKAAAVRSHESMAGCIREAVDLWLAAGQGRDTREATARALAVIGRFASGDGRLSTNHDEALAEAFK